jgi:two-component system response regulator MprA
MVKLNKKILILVVEDEVIIARTLEERLMAEGFDVIKGSDGDEGLKLALSEHPDLILLDLLMPRVDGLTMLKNLRGDSWGAGAAVIILTNVSDLNKVAEGMKAGLDGTYEYLVKSNWSLDEVVSKIKQKLEINI